MKHTKGPWIKNSHWTNECNGTRIEGLEITDTDGNIICLTWDSEFPEETDEANAQLIAAAPELLEACKGLMKQAVSDAEQYQQDAACSIWAYIADAADAIAKAERETK